MMARLGVNIDHIATLRQLRGTPYPDLCEAAALAEKGGAEQITVHLREDRRHIQDDDVKQLRKKLNVPLNLEMAVSPFMLRFAAKVKPDWVCLVPEKRQEVTTEGGLNVLKNKKKVGLAIAQLKKVGIKVSCFIEPDAKPIRLSQELGADAVEFHTGQFCLATQGALGAKSASRAKKELERIHKAAFLTQKLGLHCHAGHGLDYQNVRQLVELEQKAPIVKDEILNERIPLIEEYNIGHSIVCRAAIVGLERAVREMASAIQAP